MACFWFEYLYANEADRNSYERQMNGENPNAGCSTKPIFESAEMTKLLKWNN